MKALRWSVRSLDFILGPLLEFLVAAVLLVQFVVILAGVVARFVFNAPLTWSDELASVLMPWAAMLGAVVALRRGEHMRLAVVVDLLPERVRRFIEAAAMSGVLLLFIALLWPAYRVFDAQRIVTLTTLGISDGFRMGALLVGIVLLAVCALMLLLRAYPPGLVFGAIGVALIVGLLLRLAGAEAAGAGHFNLLLFFGILFSVCVFGGVPIAFAIGIATASYLCFGISVPLTVLVNRMSAGMSDLILLAIPLFVLLGLLIEATGVARALLAFVGSLIGHVRGGFAYVLLAAMYLVSGISGSKTADMAAVAPGLVPELEKSGMPRGELAALMASSAAMSETIPPSLVLIVLGASTGISIAALFTAGLVPAAMCAIALVIVAWRRTRTATVAPRASWAQMGRAFTIAIPALLLPLLIRFSVTEGVATATEVATIGIVYTLVIGIVVYTGIRLRELFSILLYTASLSGVVFMILGMGTAMAWALTRSGFAQDLLGLLHGLPGGAGGFMIGSIIGFIVLGSVLEGLPAILVFGPLTLPLARALGIHDVHYAMVIIIAMGIGLFAPPFGTGYYAACVISGVSPDAAMTRVWPYLGAVLAALLIIAFVPWLSIGLLAK